MLCKFMPPEPPPVEEEEEEEVVVVDVDLAAPPPGAGLEALGAGGSTFLPASSSTSMAYIDGGVSYAESMVNVSSSAVISFFFFLSLLLL